MSFEILDVGCGDRARGDVNIDLYPEKSEHRNMIAINLKAIRNFIKADVQYLPIKTKSFKIVYSHHVIEHLDDPYEFIRECVRVAYRKVIIILPHRYNLGKRCKVHKGYFGVKWFTKVLKNYEKDIETLMKPFPSKFGIFMWMKEIKVTIFL